jgi:hypothetical protein
MNCEDKKSPIEKGDIISFVMTFSGIAVFIVVNYFIDSNFAINFAGTMACLFFGSMALLLFGCAILGYRVCIKGTGGNRIAGVFGSFFGVMLAFIVFGSLLPPLGRATEKARRISCQSNLKQLGLALQQYASDNGGQLPSCSAVKAFEILRTTGYLVDVKIFLCPSSGQKSCKGTLTDASVSYVYFGNGRDIHGIATDSPLAADKSGNHKDYGNILWGDWQVRGCLGQEWKCKAKDFK